LPFEEDDEEVFYGPERLTTELAVRLARQMIFGGVVGVTGASEFRKRRPALNVVAQVIWSSPATELSLAGGTKHHLPGAHMLCTRAQQR
jgi:hypothetical protein